MGVFHAGERAVQRRAGVDADARHLGRGITANIPDGAAAFLRAQRIAALAGIDSAGRVWASLVTGDRGFITAPDMRTLWLAATLPLGDPLREAIAPEQPLGVLVFDPERRRRLRVNGRISAAQPGVIALHTEEVFGNCPKYIQGRAPDAGGRPRSGEVVQRGSALTPPQRQRIERADTLFIASVHAAAGADASHRGGQPGFVSVVDAHTVRLPDYPGNNMFQTLGNVAADPRVGLLFVDFDTGTTLQLTGRARIVWDVADAPAGRVLEISIDETVEIAGAGPLGWRFVDYSPFNPRLPERSSDG